MIVFVFVVVGCDCVCGCVCVVDELPTQRDMDCIGFKEKKRVENETLNRLKLNR